MNIHDDIREIFTAQQQQAFKAILLQLLCRYHVFFNIDTFFTLKNCPSPKCNWGVKDAIKYSLQDSVECKKSTKVKFMRFDIILRLPFVIYAFYEINLKILHVFSCKFNPAFISLLIFMNCRLLPSRAIFFRFVGKGENGKKNRRTFTTLKANSNLKQSKNKIRMLKEIKMLHNKITKTKEKNTMEV